MEFSAPAAKPPRISVVTPSFNQGRFLEECMLSVLNQGYPNLEYVVIDGGSSDRSVEIVRKYAGRLAYWVSEPDGGQADAINKGLRRSTGEVVAWLNSDDYYLPGALAAVAEAYAKNPHAPFYFGDGYRVDEKGQKLATFYPDGKVLFSRLALIYGLNNVLQPATFMNRARLAEVNYLDESLRYGLDTDLWIRLAEKTAPVAVPVPLAASREYGATKTSTGSFERVEELRRIAERHSGLALTPGVLNYFLHTLYELAVERGYVYPPPFQVQIVKFWKSAQKLLATYGARPDGFLEAPAAAACVSAGSPGEPGASAPGGLETAASAIKTLKIGIDFRFVTLGGAGGIAVLLKGVLRSLFAQYPQHDFHLFTTIYNRGLLEDLPGHVQVHTFATAQYVKFVTRALADEQIDVLFRGYPVEDHLKFPLERQVVLIPDIQHEVYPEFFDRETLRVRRLAFNSILGRAGAVGTISAFARETLLEHEWTRCRDIFLMPPALSVGQESAHTAGLSEAEKALIPDGDFFLYPANLWPHKNHRLVLRAFAQALRDTGRRATFVLTGHPDGWAELRKEFPGLPVRHLGFVRPALLRALLTRARALAFFSLYEGFGMPLLDAFHAGTPVLCSNTTSLPEVGGDAVLSCDPTDVPAMSGLMARVLRDDGLRAELAARGKGRLAEYTWEKSARNLFEAIERVATRADCTPSEPAPSEPPLVTIVTPSYNQAQYLRRTIDSVLNQTYPHIEYLVMDGGSTDGSVDILRSYGDRFRWVSEPDKGQTDAINKGLARARGTICAYLNSDDMLAPDAVAKAVAYFQSHPDCEVIYGKAAYVDKEDRVTGMYNTREYSFEELMAYCIICQPAAFWRSRIAKAVGPFDDTLSYAMDYEYWLRIDRAGGRIEHLPELLAYSRLYAETKTLSGRDKVYGEIFRICQQHGGYVHYNYFLGLWEYLCTERPTGLARRLRRIPRFYTAIAPRLHFRWHHRRQITWRRAPQALVRFGRQVGGEVLGRLGKALRRLGNKVLPGLMPGRPVEGFWPDNWMEPTCTIRLKNRLTGHALRVAGTAPVNTEVQVVVDGRVVKSRPLQANRYEEITFGVEPGSGKRVQFKFSHCITDHVPRHISFLVQDTNLFTEQDLAA
jgi:glycosyltransferase involved in cell wall biosynthesis